MLRALKELWTEIKRLILLRHFIKIAARTGGFGSNLWICKKRELRGKDSAPRKLYFLPQRGTQMLHSVNLLGGSSCWATCWFHSISIAVPMHPILLDSVNKETFERKKCVPLINIDLKFGISVRYHWFLFQLFMKNLLNWETCISTIVVW